METYTGVCSNPWCKAHFSYTENDFIKNEDEIERPKECNKCRSFSNQMSGGVEWKDKTYEGTTNDGPHEIKYRVTNYKL